jgi:hypothetical protein
MCPEPVEGRASTSTVLSLSKDQLVAAYVGAGSTQERLESYHQLPVVNGMIKVPDGNGTRQVVLA